MRTLERQKLAEKYGWKFFKLHKIKSGVKIHIGFSCEKGEVKKADSTMDRLLNQINF